MSSSSIKYNYNVNTRSALFFSKFTAFVAIIVLLVLILGLVAMEWYWGFVVLAIALICFYNYFSRKKKVIILHHQFMLVGDDIVYFSNIEKVVLDGKKKILQLTICGGNATLNINIRADLFKTDARKDWKIKKHQYNKFIKVSEKIFIKLKERSPNTIIEVVDCPELYRYEIA